MSDSTFKIIECPRDAMQGRKEFIPTDAKIDYLNRLLTVGFEAIDCGSFVSPKAIPQMADTKEVLDNIDTSATKSKLSVVVANKNGAIKAAEHEKVDIIGFPFSISESFQQFNTNKSREEAFDMVKEMIPLAEIYVHEVDNANQIDGFIGLNNDYIEGIFIKDVAQSKGTGKQLLDQVKKIKSTLKLNVYQKNERAIQFYLREEFSIQSECVDDNTGEKEFTMVWKC